MEVYKEDLFELRQYINKKRGRKSLKFSKNRQKFSQGAMPKIFAKNESNKRPHKAAKRQKKRKLGHT